MGAKEEKGSDHKKQLYHMKVKLLLTALLLASLSMEAQTVNPTSFAATVCAEQLMANNVSPAYMVGWAKDVKGQDIPAAQAPIASHVTSLLIDASDVPGTVGSIAVYAAGKEAIAGPMVFDGEHVDVLQGGSASVYASSGQSDVVLVKGESKTCTAYLLPVDLPKGVMVTVHTTDGKYYSQSFSQPISGGASLPLKVTATTASQLWMATLPGYLSKLREHARRAQRVHERTDRCLRVSGRVARGDAGQRCACL